ncbi:MAG: Holliday junction resolvase RuvX [Planctomycetales bacterium]|nr:Holliday junction resolvase RuvX [Planctomycetales bacterium]
MNAVVLAVDYGRARIGVAASDALGITAAGVATVSARDPEKALAEVAALARERGAEALVVGHPLNMDGTVGPMAREAERFAAALRARVACPVHLFDERLTSWQVEREMRDAGVKRKRRRQASDRAAAALILRSWLARQGSGPTGAR